MTKHENNLHSHAHYFHGPQLVLFWQSVQEALTVVGGWLSERRAGGRIDDGQTDTQTPAARPVSMFPAPVSGPPAACDPSWGCGSRRGPPGSPGAWCSSSRLSRRARPPTRGRAKRWVKPNRGQTLLIFGVSLFQYYHLWITSLSHVLFLWSNKITV